MNKDIFISNDIGLVFLRKDLITPKNNDYKDSISIPFSSPPSL